MSSAPLNSKQLKAEALRLGFHACGLAPAGPVDEAFMAHYENWLRQGRQGEMHYMENHLDLRRDPRLLLPGAQTVVSLAMSYNPGKADTQKSIAWYAQGKDYHDVLRERLGALVSRLSPSPLPPESFRICVDTAPVMEKYWAWRCGLGWIGRHTQLVIPRRGSAFFLAEILTTLEADEYTPPPSPSPSPSQGGGNGNAMPTSNYLPSLGGAGGGCSCGRCRRCLDACPTRALSDEGIDARRCLSYLTIEHRGELPPWAKPHLSECFYGCDRCLRACPHMRADTPSDADEEFRPSAELLAMTPEQWQTLTPEHYRQLFRGSAVKRAKYEGLMRNITSPQSDDSKAEPRQPS